MLVSTITPCTTSIMLTDEGAFERASAEDWFEFVGGNWCEIVSESRAEQLEAAYQQLLTPTHPKES